MSLSLVYSRFGARVDRITLPSPSDFVYSFLTANEECERRFYSNLFRLCINSTLVFVLVTDRWRLRENTLLRG